MGGGLLRGMPPVAECPPDTVHLFQFVRGPYCPSMSPFPIKVETYLRMAKIPYQNDLGNRFSKKGKIPWMKYNDVVVSDSQLMIEFLNKTRGVDLNKHLSTQEKAVARAFQRMIDDSLYWAGCYYRWVTDAGFKMNLLGFGDNFIIKRFARSRMKKECESAGIARNSPEEIKNICLGSLQALSDFLGDKEYFMGDQPCELDCSAFGHLAQYCYQMGDGLSEKFVPDHFPNLLRYVERMKERYWPDWDDCITHGGTKKATK